MPKPRTLYTERLSELLAEGPQPRQLLVDEMASLVEEDVALRRQAQDGSGPNRPREKLVAVGQRMVAINKLANLRAEGWIDQWVTEDGTKMVAWSAKKWGVRHSRTAPWAKEMIEVLQKGPMKREKLIARLQGLVPPGRAYRTYIGFRAYQREFYGKTGTPKKTKWTKTQEDQIRAGQRRIIQVMMNNWRNRGRLIFYEYGGRVYVALPNHKYRGRLIPVGERPEETRSLVTPSLRIAPRRRSVAKATPKLGKRTPGGRTEVDSDAV